MFKKKKSLILSLFFFWNYFYSFSNVILMEYSYICENSFIHNL